MVRVGWLKRSDLTRFAKKNLQIEVRQIKTEAEGIDWARTARWVIKFSREGVIGSIPLDQQKLNQFKTWGLYDAAVVLLTLAEKVLRNK